ncbi:hypothetical protein CAOG_06422 [Capsaspora owczarzaki ATCC 30864]|uniref:Structural maintenance of chromosomes protein 5 n=1 Tax=Capsaspora owczarzaki (strain ATCC 30864) TaxID=595528 RepID=A0A0D2WV91_CAPO3|nr:hypothetical protein CAOG_06422 [Capsaspora owczarzaki ATCC 30864]KJE96048.1 hypothetical protein CAOG_006422 [Capsaspora owczarzaki ATCC 30864]|eukprot:XP_004345171.1 hypothetical protein CAOG_06422 [Capsaspora owczarzaki ATCC 30864]
MSRRPAPDGEDNHSSKRHQASRDDSDGENDESNAMAHKRNAAAQSVLKQQLKRQSEDVYMTGSIVRVNMIDFVTYSRCEVFPGPHLNVVIGPNGTGKSTIICAIAIGLGADVKLLGRQESVRQYIRRHDGVKSATLEVELFNPDGNNWIIRRIIALSPSPESQFFLNNKSVTHKEIRELVGKLNIDFNNRTQFLPQDRVVEFAKLSPEELLLTTERDVSDNETLYNQHMELCKLFKDRQDIEKRLEENSKEHLLLQRKNAELEQQVRQYEDREQYRTQIELIQKKRPWVEYEAARSVFIQNKEQLTAAKEELRKLDTALNPVRAKITALKGELASHDSARRALTLESTELEKKIRAKGETMDTEFDKLDAAASRFKSQRSSQEQHQQVAVVLQREIAGLEQQLADIRDDVDVTPKLEKLSIKFADIREKLAGLKSQRAGTQQESYELERQIKTLQGRLQTMNSVRARRLEKLRQLEPETCRALEWLDKNRAKFSGEVAEPMMLSLTVRNPEHVDMLESCIRKSDLTSFVFERRDDMNLFLQEMRGQRLLVNACSPDPKPLTAYRANMNDENSKPLKAFGFVDFLLNLFDAPDLIKKRLCDTSNFHDIPFGDNRVEQHRQLVVEKAGLRNFVTAQRKYQIHTSKYGDQSTTTKITNHPPARYLSNQASSGEQDRLASELAEATASHASLDKELRGLVEKERAMAEEESSCIAERAKLQQQRNARKTLQNTIDTRKARLAAARRSAQEAEREANEAHAAVQRHNSRRAAAAIGLQRESETIMDNVMRRAMASLRTAQIQADLEVHEGMERQQSETLTAARNEVEALQRAVNEAKTRASALLDLAKVNPITEELQQKFPLFPATLEELDALLHHYQALVDSNLSNDPGVVEQYKQRSDRILDLQQKVDKLRADVQDFEKNENKLKDDWLTPLQEKVQKINVAFGNGFQLLGYSGEVTLRTDADYSKYAIEISVKFRQSESLMRLTANHQSGGERTVSTMIYLLSLQQLTKCPFRIVDEINQGMDPTNERRIFRQVVHGASAPNTAQCFYVTPKLLPNLDYNEKVQVLCVYNGPLSVPCEQWDVARFIQAARQQKQVSAR